MVIPPTGRESVSVELHGGHPGVSHMKSLACGLVWWPNLDTEIEKMVGQCLSCQQCQPSPPAAPMQPWSWPANPWSCLHIDFAGPVAGKMILVVVDTKSKWIEAYPMAAATAGTTIQQLRQLFAQFGIPQLIMLLNLKLNGIHHI